MLSHTTQPQGQDWDHPAQTRRPLASAWLILGVSALAMAGLFALLLVAARAPGTGAWFPTQDFFRVALIVHVDQSVLIWFLAFAGALCALGARPLGVLSWLAFVTAAAGCLLVSASPFLGALAPHLNNYVPVLDHPLFLIGLGLFALGVLLHLTGYLVLVRGDLSWSDPLAVGTLSVAFAALLAAVTLGWTWIELPATWEGKAFYEYLFWGPGHVLQFAYTQLLLVAWIWMARASGRALPLSDTTLSAILVLGILPLAAVPLIHGFHAPDSAQTRLAYTSLMQWGNGLAAVPIGLALLVALLRRPGESMGADSIPVRRALWASVTLFAAGGVLAVLIAGSNTIVPAHYHGSIVGVTLALMGLSYHLLPRLGFGRPQGRTARVQPWIYGAGQLLHIGGLAASGTMGIQRKTAGAAQGLDSLAAKLSMGVMGIGGLLAVIGGILFVLVVIGALGRRPD